MLYYAIIIITLFSILKVLGACLMCWLYIKNRCISTLWLAVGLVALVLVDVLTLNFPTEIYVIKFGMTVRTFAADVQLALYLVHYLSFVLAGVTMLRTENSGHTVPK